jgi:acyl-CoA thioesterase-1
MQPRFFFFAGPLILALAAACGQPSGEPAPAASAIPEPTAAGSAAPGEELPPLVVFLGDSLTAGRGLEGDQAFPAVVQHRIADRGLPIRTLNAGVSGDTTAGGVRRLEWLLRRKPDVVVVELGANDGLRGLPLEMTEENLRTIITSSREAGAAVLLVGMMMPPNYGPDYTGGFRAIYPRLAKETRVPLLPFLLEGVAGDPSLNLADGIHPNAEGHRRVAESLLPHLERILRERSPL